MGGNIQLAQVVLERSKRAGVGIDTRDNDGWTPLLWANGADPNARGKGVDRQWTVHEVAYYYHADR
ncbi:hypothetical protein FGSG_12636 [Fusarium graminearum PH-1]|uniref:hypothetical protein n=1 Tax=Gibberella zeae (strain ATCC MYA-4620 / CBS 123657 / FGSC 9075 / NRRL 31084 / PH-1) TaxID=229533 RepID=UPI00021F1F1D|nr:hypothetical protein FGSG_12636 [Fusarium graminearum PH-1]ESU10729.1 hypothetical protein FGSG_12636 [Fusarium graminearum PH-1]|eukprot:XP_011323305.1 hypothetical protein FGSG_12636 [Fusarium graminearum PH-1]